MDVLAKRKEHDKRLHAFTSTILEGMSVQDVSAHFALEPQCSQIIKPFASFFHLINRIFYMNGYRNP